MGGQTRDGGSNLKELKTEEIFPSQACVQNICSIPDLPQGRPGHTLSILSSGWFVVCGGVGEEYSDPDNDYGSGDGDGGSGEEYSDPDNDYGYGAGNVTLTTNSYTSTNNTSAGNQTNTRSTQGPLDDCLQWKYGAANASWVHHDTYMRFASF